MLYLLHFLKLNRILFMIIIRMIGLEWRRPQISNSRLIVCSEKISLIFCITSPELSLCRAGLGLLQAGGGGGGGGVFKEINDLHDLRDWQSGPDLHVSSQVKHKILINEPLNGKYNFSLKHLLSSLYGQLSRKIQIKKLQDCPHSQLDLVTKAGWDNSLFTFYYHQDYGCTALLL